MYSSLPSGETTSFCGVPPTVKVRATARVLRLNSMTVPPACVLTYRSVSLRRAKPLPIAGVGKAATTAFVAIRMPYTLSTLVET